VRLNHNVLTTIYEHDTEDEETKPQHAFRDALTLLDMSDQGSIYSQATHATCASSQPDHSPTSMTDDTTFCTSQSSSTSTTTDYNKAWTCYRIANLHTRKHTIATQLRVSLDQAQFLLNQLHLCMSQFNTMTQFYCEKTAYTTVLTVITEDDSLALRAEKPRLAIRQLLNENQPLIKECEGLLKSSKESNLELDTKERLALNRVMTALVSSSEPTTTTSTAAATKVSDNGLLKQQAEIIAFNRLVGELIDGLEEQNTRLLHLVRHVNDRIHGLKVEIDGLGGTGEDLRAKSVFQRLFRLRR
jgi:hypothetical protein